MTTLICNCNQTMPLDAVALSQAPDEPLALHRTLGRREASAFQKAVRNPDGRGGACAIMLTRIIFLSVASEPVVELCGSTSPPRTGRLI